MIQIRFFTAPAACALFFGSTIVSANPPGTLLWEAAIDGDGWGCPSVADDGSIIYCTHQNGGVIYKIDPSDGSILASVQAAGGIEHSAAIDANGNLYVTTLRTPIASGGYGVPVAASYQISDLALRWQTSIESGADTSPILGNNDRVYLGVVWHPDTPGHCESCAAGLQCGRYYSFDTNTGETKIDMWLEGWAATPGIVDEDNRVFFGVEDATGCVSTPGPIWPGLFYGIDGNDPADGSGDAPLLFAPFPAIGDFGAPMSYHDGIVYTTCRDGFLYGFDHETGAVVLQHDLGGSSWSGISINHHPDPANSNLVLYTGTQLVDIGRGGHRKLIAVELDGSFTGSRFFDTTVPGGMTFGNIAIDDLGNLYHHAGANLLQARDAYGTLLWTYPLAGGGGLGGPTILDDGTIVIGTNDGKLIALAGNGNHLAYDAPWPKYKHDLRNTSNVNTPLDPNDSSIPGDVNGDGDVNGADLALVLVAWNTSTSDADLNSDGIVNGADLALILVYWTG